MRKVFVVMVLLAPLPAAAVPPPPAQVTADCDAPSYASDQLVCADAELRGLDRLLAKRIAERGARENGITGNDGDLEWFRRSRRCAFEADHRDCLRTAYCLRLALVSPFGADSSALCNPPTSGYLPAASLSRSGFARRDSRNEELRGRDIRVWGFVDHGNIYGDAAAREILGDWWSGDAPNADSWRFDLKAAADDPVGASFSVHVPVDLLRDDLLRVFVADARSGRATRVYLEGNLRQFDAPTGLTRLVGLRLELESSRAIGLWRPGPE
jgi:uncharacterized protein